MLTEAALSFLSIGVQPPAASWGTIIGDGQDVALTCKLRRLPGDRHSRHGLVNVGERGWLDFNLHYTPFDHPHGDDDCGSYHDQDEQRRDLQDSSTKSLSHFSSHDQTDVTAE